MRRSNSLTRLIATLLSFPGQLRSITRNYYPIKSPDSLAKQYKQAYSSGISTLSLDLGCGNAPRNPFGAKSVFGVDLNPNLSYTNANIKIADLSTDDIPYDTSSFDYCTAYDVLEHIPRLSWPLGKRRASFIELMNEIFRILKPNGLFLYSVPVFPSKKVFQDPTHVNLMTEDTIPIYFSNPGSLANQLGYGFTGNFDLLEQRWIKGSWIAGILVARK